MPQIDKIVLVTKKTPLQELVERFGSVDQARFYLQQSGDSFKDIEEFHERYERGLTAIRESILECLRYQEVDREFLPNFVFGPNDLVATLGPDGLVVNAAKYVDRQAIVAFNPDPSRIDGVLAPFYVVESRKMWLDALADRMPIRELVMAEATLNNGQTLLGVNDLFVGQKTHVSARYEIHYDGKHEQHSSSGIIISTGAGSTGWYKSVVTGAYGIAGSLAPKGEKPQFSWPADKPELRFSVREPFESRASQSGICAGRIEAGQILEIVSRMPQNGVIFSDGIEEDFLPFNSGCSARIGIAGRRVRLGTRI